MSRRGLCRNFFCKTATIRDILLFQRNPKNRVRQVHWIFQNPPRKPQSHRILAVFRVGDPKRYFCTFGEKEQTSKRQTNEYKEFVWSKARFATRTRLRTNPSRTPKIHQILAVLSGGGVIRANIILRATHLMSLRGTAKSGSPRDTVYSRGKGVCKHKTTDCRLRQSVGQKRSIRRISRKGHRITKPTQDTFVLAWRKRRKQA